MSRPLLVVFVLLLVLRGWMGDAMAMQVPIPVPMAAAHCPPVHAAGLGADAHAVHGGMAAGPAGLHEAAHAQAPAEPAADADACGDSSASHSGCGECQVCHTVALPFGFSEPAVAPALQALPVTPPVAYASADPAPGFKPPIFRSSRP